MASFFKRGKTWYYSIDIGYDKDGKRKKQSRGGFKKKKDAEDVVLAIKNDLVNGTFVQESDTSFTDFSKTWLKSYALQVKTSSVRIRSNEIKRLYDYFNIVKIKDITKKQYQDCLLDLLERNFSENTISGIHGTAKMIFRKAVELDIIKSDPTEFSKAPHKQQTLEEAENIEDIPKYLEKDELATFLNFVYDLGIKDDYVMFLTLAYTGMRVGELCGLKWEDIDFDAKTIDIKRTYWNPNCNIKKYELHTPKTKASRRKIDVNDKIINELRAHQIRQNITKMKKINVWFKGDFIFTATKYPGYPQYIKIVENRMERIFRISEMKKSLTPHSLRHTHTSLLAEAGVGLEEIMERLGHVDDNTTKQVYLHVTKDMKKEAVRKLDLLMDNL